MKTVLLCGGLGSRMQDGVIEIPKPLVTINKLPLLQHVMKIYSSQGYNDFILAGGYKFEMIKQYFCNYYMYNSNLLVDTSSGNVVYLRSHCELENFKVYLIDTGVDTETGGRLLKVKDYIDEDVFMCNYSDGLADIDLNNLVKFHKNHGKIATLIGVRKHGKFGNIQIDGDFVTSFEEKPVDNDYINGGFFVFNKEFFDYTIDGDLPLTLEVLIKEENLMVYKHQGRWECVDTLRDKNYLEELCSKNEAFWEM